MASSANKPTTQGANLRPYTAEVMPRAISKSGALVLYLKGQVLPLRGTKEGISEWKPKSKQTVKIWRKVMDIVDYRLAYGKDRDLLYQDMVAIRQRMFMLDRLCGKRTARMLVHGLNMPGYSDRDIMDEIQRHDLVNNKYYAKEFLDRPYPEFDMETAKSIQLHQAQFLIKLLNSQYYPRIGEQVKQPTTVSDGMVDHINYGELDEEHLMHEQANVNLVTRLVRKNHLLVSKKRAAEARQREQEELEREEAAQGNEDGEGQNEDHANESESNQTADVEEQQLLELSREQRPRRSAWMNAMSNMWNELDSDPSRTRRANISSASPGPSSQNTDQDQVASALSKPDTLGAISTRSSSKNTTAQESKTKSKETDKQATMQGSTTSATLNTSSVNTSPSNSTMIETRFSTKNKTTQDGKINSKNTGKQTTKQMGTSTTLAISGIIATRSSTKNKTSQEDENHECDNIKIEEIAKAPATLSCSPINNLAIPGTPNMISTRSATKNKTPQGGEVTEIEEVSKASILSGISAISTLTKPSTSNMIATRSTKNKTAMEREIKLENEDMDFDETSIMAVPGNSSTIATRSSTKNKTAQEREVVEIDAAVNTSGSSGSPSINTLAKPGTMSGTSNMIATRSSTKNKTPYESEDIEIDAVANTSAINTLAMPGTLGIITTRSSTKSKTGQECENEITQLSALMKAAKIKSDINSKERSKQVDKNGDLSQPGANTTGIVICSYCSRIFDHQRALIGHLRIHSTLPDGWEHNQMVTRNSVRRN